MITGLATAFTIIIVTLPRIIFLLIRSKGHIDTNLVKPPYIILEILGLLSSLASFPLAFYFSRDFFYFGIFFTFLMVSVISAFSYFVLFIFYFQRGEEARFQFALGKIVAPFTILGSIVMLTTALTTLNFWLLIPTIVYFVSMFIVDYKGYKDTKPNFTKDPEKEDRFDEYN